MRRFLLLVVLFLALSGCQARTSVAINVEPNGSGSIEAVVTLDKEAAAGVPNLETDLRTSDLTRNGWKVDVDKKGDNTIVKAHHAFDGASEADTLLQQLGGPFENFDLDVKRSLSRTTTEFHGVIELSRGLETFGDATLQQRVGSPLGFDSAEMQRALGLDYAAMFPVEVTVDLPGTNKVTTSGHYGAVTPIEARSSAANPTPLIFFTLGGICALAAIVVAILWKSGRYRPAHRKKRGSVRVRDLLEG